MLAKIAIPVVVLGSVVLASPALEVAGLDVTSHAMPVLSEQQPQQQSEMVITLSSKGSNPKVGIPDFVIAGNNAALQAVAKTMGDVLAYDLDFEREFTVVSRSVTASIPAATTPETLPFSRWAEAGADYVLLGTASASGDRMPVDVRMVSVKGTTAGQSVGFTYDGCSLANPRYCAHFIADDLHFKIRNVEGVARTRFAFSSDRDAMQMPGRPQNTGGQGKEVYLADYDGANQMRLTVNRNLNIAPKWGPDPRTLGYTSYVTGFPDVYLTLLDGRAPLKPGGGTEEIHNMLPAISPNGNRIAYASTRGSSNGHWDIWVADRDGRNLQNLTPNTPNSTESAPTWSPSGTQLAFTSDRVGSNQIYIMNVDGTGVQKLTAERRTDRPSWSSQNYIAYSTERPAGNDVAVFDIATGRNVVVTDGLGSNEGPSVAPNGRHIAFVTTRWGRDQIAVVDYPSPGKVRRITESGTNTYPSWSPSPKVSSAK